MTIYIEADMNSKKIQQEVAKAARAFRKVRNLTQREIAHALGISQSRYSEIENGKGSFSAEQLIILITKYNVPIGDFLGGLFNRDTGTQLQNALSRLGAEDLMEDHNVLPSEKLAEINDVIVETIVSALSSRQITALATILVRHAGNINFGKILQTLHDLALEGRLWWIVDSTLAALNHIINKDALSRENARLFVKAAIDLDERTGLGRALFNRERDSHSEDILDKKEIASEKTYQEILKRRSEIAKKWKVVTRISTEDFIDVLRKMK